MPLRVITALVDGGADLTYDGALGNILHCACELGNVDVIEYVYTQRPALATSRNRQGKTPLEMCSTPELRAIVGKVFDEQKTT
jgi:hypothetical protein